MHSRDYNTVDGMGVETIAVKKGKMNSNPLLYVSLKAVTILSPKKQVKKFRE